MKERDFIILSGIVVLVLVGVLVFLVEPVLTGNVIAEDIEINKTILVQEMNVIFEVIDERIIGINADNDALKYGTIIKGGYGKRGIIILNPFNFTVKVFLSFSENIKDSMNIKYDDFILEKKGQKKMKVMVLTDDLEIGEYEGKMFVRMERF